MYMNPLSFTISDVNGSTVISGGIINDPSRFDDDGDLLDYAFLCSNAPVFHVDYVSYLLDVGDGDVQHPSEEELDQIRSMVPELLKDLDFIEGGSYEVKNPYWEAEE